MPAAIRPYSIAVAPDSSETKWENRLFMMVSFTHTLVELDEPLAGVPAERGNSDAGALRGI
jgi:hypothetical protein